MTSHAHLRLMVMDQAAASRRAARLLARELTAPAPVLGLATGSSVELAYRELAALVRADPGLRDGIRRARGFALDEYVGLPAGHPNSYRATLENQFAVPAGLPLDHLHVPSPTDIEDAGRYDERIAAAGGVAVQLLGIGGNGHIGFNEPGSPLDSRTRLINLDERTRQDNARFFASLDEVPTQAVTQGIGTIMNARRLVVLAFGKHKARALSAALSGPVTPQLPASALQRHPDVIVLADPDAASLLPAGTALNSPAPGPSDSGDGQITRTFGKTQICYPERARGDSVTATTDHRAGLAKGVTVAPECFCR